MKQWKEHNEMKKWHEKMTWTKWHEMETNDMKWNDEIKWWNEMNDLK
jgi:hypothetical protein